MVGNSFGCVNTRRLNALGGLLIWMLLGCQPSIQLAYIGPLSGPDHLYGRMESQAAQLAVLDFNAQNSARTQARLLLVDTSNVPLDGLVKRLRKRHRVQAIVGPPSSELARKLVEQLEGNQMVMVSASASNPQLTFKNSWFFRLQPSDEVQSEVMALFLVQKLKKTRTAVLYSAGNYGEPLGKNFMASYRHAGGTIVSSDQEHGDNARQLAQLRSLGQQGKIDAIYLATDLAGSQHVLQALRGIELHGITLVGSDAFSKLELRQFSPGELDGFYYATAALRPENKGELERVLRDYGKIFNSQPDIFAVNAYDAIALLLNTIKQLHQTEWVISGEDIRQAILHARDYPGVGGKISFKETGEVERGISVYQFLEGRPSYLGGFRIRSGKLVADL